MRRTSMSWYISMMVPPVLTDVRKFAFNATYTLPRRRTSYLQRRGNMSATNGTIGRVYHETHGHVMKIVIDNTVKKNSFSPEIMAQR